MKKYLILSALFALSLLRAEFPIGFYNVIPPNEQHFKAVKDCGGNYVHAYYNPYNDSEDMQRKIQRQLDLAQEHGLKVNFRLVHPSILKEPDYMERTRKVILKYKDHPALGLWYIYDEPRDDDTRKKLRQIYRMLKQLTPDIPVWMCVNWHKGFEKFTDCSDVVMLDTYPVQDQEFPNAPLNNFATFIWQGKAMRKPIVPVAQIFSYKTHPEEIEKFFKNSDPAKCRYPNATEIRYFNFATMAMDIAGIFYYSYHQIMIDNQKRYVREVLQPEIFELSEFARTVEGMQFIPHTGTPGTTGLPKYLCASWTGKDGVYVILVNNSKETLSDDFKLKARLPAGKLIPWGKTRQTDAESTGTNIKLAELTPWEVMIWKHN